MAIRIVDVELVTIYRWQDVGQKADWNAIKNTNADWRQIVQTSLPGQIVQVRVEVSENNWNSIRDNHMNWQHVREKFNSWADVKSY